MIVQLMVFGLVTATLLVLAGIAAMIFTGVVVTDAEGRPLQDPATGEPVVEEDGC